MKYIPFVLLIGLAGCAADPISTHKTDNQNVSVDLLFEHDGCTVYRFYDDGRYHYYAKCPNASASTTTQQQSGKTTVPEEIPTP